jgi:multidrug efflux pump subunit AcrA (membrane-fusion protein)
MVRKLILNFSIIISVAFVSVNAQDADPIEAARQAKLAAEKAAADAEAATGVAIEAAAAKAAAGAREKIIADREAEKARLIAEKEAAEDAEIDAAAEAAALQARRKLAAELGLDLEEVPDSSVNAQLLTDDDIIDSGESESPLKGFNFGFTGSAGFINGAYITNLPVGGSFVVTTPFGFKIGNTLDFTVSFAVGTYNAEAANSPIEAILYGVGGNLMIKDMVFTENQIGVIGEGFGIRSFSGISLERLMKKGLNMPLNILIGAEGFITSNANTVLDETTGENMENASYWGGLGIRLDYSF